MVKLIVFGFKKIISQGRRLRNRNIEFSQNDFWKLLMVYSSLKLRGAPENNLEPHPSSLG